MQDYYDARALSAVPGVKIKSIELADGKVHSLPSIGVTAIVGGNNTGKSTLLRQLSQSLVNGPSFPATQQGYLILQEVKVEVTDTIDAFYGWISRNAHLQGPTPEEPTKPRGYVRPGSRPIDESVLHGIWPNMQRGIIAELAPFLVYYADAGARSGVTFTTSMRQRPDMPPSDYIHYLEDSGLLRKKLDDVYLDIFGEHLTLDIVGIQRTLRIGSPPAGLEDLRTYGDALPIRQALDKMSRLDGQGDGMRALLGLVLPLITATYPIIIVDEPEAFLHPPQAVKLGKILGGLARDSGVQVVLATHDRNILIGLLQSGAPLSVLRLTREGNETGSHRLDPVRIAEIWSDPVLKYSHVLDGLFHTRVVVAEHQRDCTFYAAALDAAHEENPLPFSPSEVLFVPTGGKDGLAPVVEALAELKVPVVATPDIDMLDDETKMRRLVQSFGGDWSLFSEDYRICTAKFRKQKTPVLASRVAKNVAELLDRILKEDPLREWDAELRDEFKAATRANESPWTELKRYGMRAFVKEVEARAMELLDRLDEIGLVLVREGELECFAFGFQVEERKGINWLRAALERGVHRGDAAKAHARKLATVRATVVRSSAG